MSRTDTAIHLYCGDTHKPGEPLEAQGKLFVAIQLNSDTSILAGAAHPLRGLARALEQSADRLALALEPRPAPAVEDLQHAYGEMALVASELARAGQLDGHTLTAAEELLEAARQAVAELRRAVTESK